MKLGESRIGFIGAGAMAEALLGGLRAAGVDAAALAAADPATERLEHLERALGVRPAAGNAELVRESDVVVLAVKPAVVAPVLAGLAELPEAERTRPLWISIAAGVTLGALARDLPPGFRAVRAMPNTPALVRAGATATCGNAQASEADRALARGLFESVGLVWEAPEEALLDAVTGLSGSGPAYVFAFLEALTEAGAGVGLPREAAARLAEQTLYGAALLVRESDRGPAELRRQVSSPGGTTLAGLARLEQEGFARALSEAVRAAVRRARELAAGD